MLDHVSTPGVDGMYSLLWIRPGPEGKRPYHLISEDPVDIQDMVEAEEFPSHLNVHSYQHETLDYEPVYR